MSRLDWQLSETLYNEYLRYHEIKEEQLSSSQSNEIIDYCDALVDEALNAIYQTEVKEIITGELNEEKEDKNSEDK